MTATVTNRIGPFEFGVNMAVIVDLDVTSYPTNGQSITAAILGLPSSQDPMILSVVALEDNLFFRHDQSADKLLAHDDAGEIADTTDIGVVRIFACTRNK